MGGFLFFCVGALAQGAADDPSSRIDWFELTPQAQFNPFAPYAGAVDFAPLPGTPDPEPRAMPEPRRPRTKARVVDPVKRKARGATKPKKSARRVDTDDTDVFVKPAPEEDGCGDDLEVFAAAGKLTTAAASCLQDARDEGRQVDRSAASRILMLQAAADRDDGALAELLHYHLVKLDQSDPSLCLTYAQLLHRKGGALNVTKWADTALENRHQWSGPGFVERVSQARALGARGAYRQWQALEKERSMDSSNTRAIDLARNRAKTYAREWLAYQRSAGLDSAEALGVCTSAAGSGAYCE